MSAINSPMLKIISKVLQLRSEIQSWRCEGETIALVPTMGNLHQGHLQLVHKAKELADRVVVSIFVNPLQFGAGEDLDRYPRTLEEDQRLLIEEGVDLIFAPSEMEIYPNGRENISLVTVPGLDSILCGQSRPGHFTGVATIVCKLFNIVQPDIAVFGEKDYQQLAVIRKMVRDLAMPIDVVSVHTVREASGLAMSSRNGYLSANERQQAANIYKILTVMAERIQQQNEPYKKLEEDGLKLLMGFGFTPEYLQIFEADSLTPPSVESRRLVVLVAVHHGKTRLIDNLVVDI